MHPLFVLTALAMTAAPLAADMPAPTDLDGDGTPETIRWEENLLHVGDESFDDCSAEPGVVPRVTVEDARRNDRLKELTCCVMTAGGTDACSLLTFRGGSLAELLLPLTGEDSKPTAITVSGYGIVLADYWESFWHRRERFVLGKKLKLKHHPQPFYHVGVKVSVRSSFPIYLERDTGTTVANLRPDSEIEVLLADSEGEWFLLHISSGLTGWVKESELYEHTQLVAAG